MKSFSIFSEDAEAAPTNTDAGIQPSIDDPPVSVNNKYKKKNEEDTRKMKRKIIGSVSVK